ncbi:hypothetical protein K8Z49_25280 [Actinomadura madurae]|uniref:hypothetical protein n=1 Tax=Actinomadura madurae TaxID=1993 RepID=UPI00399B603E
MTGLIPAERTRRRRDRVGIVFQRPSLLPSLTALDQLTVVAQLSGGLVRWSLSETGQPLMLRHFSNPLTDVPPTSPR